MMSDRHHRFAFTLIELVVVLLIISLTVALAAPALKGWSDGAKVRNATDDFLATTRYARSSAILNATEYVMTFDRNTNSYALSTRTDGALVALRGEWANAVELPAGCTLDVMQGSTDGMISFYPDARVTPAVVQITSPRGEVVRIGSSSPAEPFKVIGAEP